MHFVCKDKVKRLVTTRKKPAQGRLVEEQERKLRPDSYNINDVDLQRNDAKYSKCTAAIILFFISPILQFQMD